MRITFAPNILLVSGKIGTTIFSMCRRGGPYGKSAGENGSGMSPNQAARRRAFQQAAKAWGQLTDEQKSRWTDWWRHAGSWKAKQSIAKIMPGIIDDMESTSRSTGTGSGMGDGYNGYQKLVGTLLRINPFATPPSSPPTGDPPGAPTGLKLQNDGAGGIKATWDPSGGSGDTITIAIKGTGDKIHPQIVITAPASAGSATISTITGKNGVKMPISGFGGTTITGRANFARANGLTSAGSRVTQVKIN
jgi:hypothetical protein